jgi:hypothetical protein
MAAPTVVRLGGSGAQYPVVVRPERESVNPAMQMLLMDQNRGRDDIPLLLALLTMMSQQDNLGENRRQFDQVFGLQRDQFGEGRRQFDESMGFQREGRADTREQFEKLFGLQKGQSDLQNRMNELLIRQGEVETARTYLDEATRSQREREMMDLGSDIDRSRMEQAITQETAERLAPTKVRGIESKFSDLYKTMDRAGFGNPVKWSGKDSIEDRVGKILEESDRKMFPRDSEGHIRGTDPEVAASLRPLLEDLRHRIDDTDTGWWWSGETGPAQRMRKESLLSRLDQAIMNIDKFAAPPGRQARQEFDLAEMARQKQRGMAERDEATRQTFWDDYIGGKGVEGLLGGSLDVFRQPGQQPVVGPTSRPATTPATRTAGDPVVDDLLFDQNLMNEELMRQMGFAP